MKYEFFQYKNDGIELDVCFSTSGKDAYLDVKQISTLFDISNEQTISLIDAIISDEENKIVLPKIQIVSRKVVDNKEINEAVDYYSADVICLIAVEVYTKRFVHFIRWVDSLLLDIMRFNLYLSDPNNYAKKLAEMEVINENIIDIDKRLSEIEKTINKWYKTTKKIK